MLVNTRYRSTEKEIMDDFSMKGALLRKTLDQIAVINKRLGGNKATLDGLAALLKSTSRNRPLVIADLGCGNGDMLRMVADFGRKNKYAFRLVGIDNNEFTVNYARECSAAYPEISFCRMDVTGREFEEQEFDIVLCTLFLHHFSNEEIERLLTGLLEQTGTGLVINDLHRSKVAYYLFRLISIFISSSMARNDGAISILRGFKKNELVDLNKKLQDTAGSIKWKWAFRYQWIIRKKTE
ncbi:MAG TPA: methyltransferase domain-containing protein [Ferruginibacter sp.]|nr:methyltransferase [Chitinophagaceae bacterium]HRI24145.1 methyltransferase domain-containing protein [Ferruginibacter sp.]